MGGERRCAQKHQARRLPFINKRHLCLGCNQKTKVLIKQLHKVSVAPHMGQHFPSVVALAWQQAFRAPAVVKGKKLMTQCTCDYKARPWTCLPVGSLLRSRTKKPVRLTRVSALGGTTASHQQPGRPPAEQVRSLKVSVGCHGGLPVPPSEEAPLYQSTCQVQLAHRQAPFN